MKQVLTSEEMRWCDETTIRKHHIPGVQLMERAGQSVVDFLVQQYAPIDQKHFLIVCGKGNNGGDGFVIARLLLEQKASVSVLLIASPKEFKGDAETNYRLLESLHKTGMHRLQIYLYQKNVFNVITKPDVIIDAIFGTGFSRHGGQAGFRITPTNKIIAWINEQHIPVVAVDIPSGVHGTTGVAECAAICADHTVTFAAYKTGLLCNAGKILSGTIHCTDIGIPQSVFGNKKFKTWMAEAEDIVSALPKRFVHAHKYSVGKVLVLAGSTGLTGAAALTSMAAMRAGAGAVVLGTPDSVYPILAKKLTEVMVQPLPSTKEGTIAASAFKELDKKLQWADVVVVGPGLSQHPETQTFVLKLLAMYAGKLLIDADALNAIAAKGLAAFKKSKAEIIVTPHVGECSRLTKIGATEIEMNRIEAARTLAEKIKQTVVLKGVPTVTAAKDGKAFLNSTGNPGMATAGSGDVLSGIIASLWAQGMKAEQAAYCGVWLHGRSGDIGAKKLGERSLIASDLIKYLPAALQGK